MSLPNNQSLSPLPLETKLSYISRFSKLSEVIDQHPSLIKRRIIASRKWDVRVNDKHTMVKVDLANGDSYMIRENDNLAKLWFKEVPESARGTRRNDEQY